MVRRRVLLTQIRQALTQSDPTHADYKQSQYARKLVEFMVSQDNDYARIFSDWISRDIPLTPHYVSMVLAFAQYIIQDAFARIFAELGPSYQASVTKLHSHIAEQHHIAQLRFKNQLRSAAWTEQYAIPYNFVHESEVYNERSGGQVQLFTELSIRVTLRALLRYNLYRALIGPSPLLVSLPAMMSVLHTHYRIPLDVIGKMFGVTGTTARTYIDKFNKIMNARVKMHLDYLKKRRLARQKTF